MANAIYPAAKAAFLGADIDLLTDTIKVVLIDTADYTYSASHANLSDIPSGARVATSAALTGKTVTGGVFDADDLQIAGVTGDTIEALALFKDTGTAATSSLIAYIDTATGLPVTPNGGPVQIAWDEGSNKILAI